MLVVLLTGLYTVLGGMRAVAYTEALQTIILIIGSALVTYLRPAKRSAAGHGAARRSPARENVQPVEAGGAAGRIALGADQESAASGEVIGQAWYFNGNYPWLGMLFCAPIIGLWYWCTDQYIVQRASGAERNASPAGLDLRRRT